MRYKENYMVEFLNFAIDEKYKIDLSLLSGVDWEELYNEGREHNILSLIYYAIKKLNLTSNINEALFNKWKEEVFFSAIREKRQEANIRELIRTFNKESVQFVALKGTILKELYPKSEFRTMGDCDILVKEENIEKSEEILILLGYEKGEHADEHSVHKAFYKESYSVELHWSLVNEQYFNGSKNFEENIWSNLNRYNFKGEETYRLNNEYMIVHLISHMAVHSLFSGFGIRQLLDLYLFSKNYEGSIDWEETSKVLRESGMEKFAVSLYYAIEILFGYKLNKEFIKELNEDNQLNIHSNYIKQLVETILSNGVFGKKDKSLVFINSLVRLKDSQKRTTVIDLIFPSINKMESNYKYIKKYKILIPVVYIHRIFKGIFNSNFSLKDKYNFLFKTAKKADEKDSMLKNVGLK